MPVANSLSDANAIPRLGVDTGGTFTDFALYSKGRLITHKVLSTPDSPEKAILQGIRELGLASACESGKLMVIHGSTVATNAVLQGKGAKTLFIANTGLEDILTIGRQNRSDIYDLLPIKKDPPVASDLCLGCSGRIDSVGNEIEPLVDVDVQRMVSEIEALSPESIAICFLFSHLNPDHEKSIATALEKEYFVSISSEVLPETGEYERGIATWLNASLSPLIKTYLTNLASQIPPANLSVMQSSGGTISCIQASSKAVNLLLSGPAGGLAAAEVINRQIGGAGLLTFDMGGTSTDVALIKDFIRLTREGKVGRYPVSVPMVDMHTIGAGGGSVAYLDEAGMLHVGPESAGAKPGPACYGQGGTRATVTDAHMLLGNLQTDRFAGGNIELNRDASEKVIGTLAKMAGMTSDEMAQGILELANEHMARALRQISERRGEAPADYRLCSFGGAGGLHVCALAEKLEMRKAIIPANSGILSALGMLVAPGKRELSKVVVEDQQKDLDLLLNQAELLGQRGYDELKLEGYPDKNISKRFSLDCRYQGQTFTLDLPLTRKSDSSSLEEAFHSTHEVNFGYRLDRDVEFVNLRAHVEAQNEIVNFPISEIESKNTNPQNIQVVDAAAEAQETEPRRVFDRASLSEGQEILGPALICGTSSTSWIAEGWIVTVHQSGHLMLSLLH